MLETVKILLGIADETKDDLLNAILTLTEKRMCFLCGGAEAVPDELEYIVTEVTVRRFNRIGSEGVESHTVEGETMTWSDDDFADYMDDIQTYLARQSDSGTGIVRFY